MLHRCNVAKDRKCGFGGPTTISDGRFVIPSGRSVSLSQINRRLGSQFSQSLQHFRKLRNRFQKAAELVPSDGVEEWRAGPVSCGLISDAGYATTVTSRCSPCFAPVMRDKPPFSQRG